jgi:L-seryl-tRNA(Ser) seleniumtransferase
MSVYDRFGVSPIVNAAGPTTRLGGAVMPEAVVEAMRKAARETVPLESLQAAASAVVARVTGAEAGIATCGASAALTLGAAAILCRNDRARMARLPDTNSIPNEFLIARDQRNAYDRAVRTAGARLVEVGWNELVSGAGVRRIELDDFEEAVGPSTAGVLYVHRADSTPPLKELVDWAHARGLAVLVDAAGALPPMRNLQALPGAGADLVAFSGGKGLRGPQNTGILCGDSELVASAALQLLDMDEHPRLWNPPEEWIDRSRFASPPKHGVGRGFKVAKEQIVGLLTALELAAAGHVAEELQGLSRRLLHFGDELAAAGIAARIVRALDAETPPTLQIEVDVARVGGDAFEVCRRLRAGTPPIYVQSAHLPEGKLGVDLCCVRPEQDSTLIRRLLEELSERLPTSRAAADPDR